jgi:hypothetical protein
VSNAKSYRWRVLDDRLNEVKVVKAAFFCSWAYYVEPIVVTIYDWYWLLPVLTCCETGVLDRAVMNHVLSVFYGTRTSIVAGTSRTNINGML